jgi:hypothetical protein
LYDEVEFSFVGVPPTWQNRRNHWAKEAQEKRVWKELTHMHAQSCRNLHQWFLPTQDNPCRIVTIFLHRVRELDIDNAYNSIQPILNGLKGALIYDDRQRYCDLSVRQVKVQHYSDQKTRIVVLVPNTN